MRVPPVAPGRAGGPRHLAVSVVALAGLLACLGAPAPARAATAGAGAGSRAFTDPRPAAIAGWAGSAMEPDISPDGRDLLFNTSNVPPSVPALEYATRSGPGGFTYRGPVVGADQSGSLSGTPSLDDHGDLYFVSDRQYAPGLATVYAGRFAAGAVTGVHLVAGVAAPAPGLVDFDVSVSSDGATLYVSVGRFGSGSGPSSAWLTVYDRVGTGFVPDPGSTRLLRAVDAPGELDYAASVSADGRELFFTRADPGGGVPRIERAVRPSVGRPFGRVQPVPAITGFAEAPSLSRDGTTLFFHQRVGDRFVIEQVTREAPGP